MKRSLACLALAAGCLAASGALAQIDGSKPVICATAEVMECVPYEACQRVGHQESGVPRFLRIDFTAKKITRNIDGDDIASDIERSESVDGRLILQGAEDGFEAVRDGLGWSLSINQELGNMVLTGSGDGVGFVIFGACTTF